MPDSQARKRSRKRLKVRAPGSGWLVERELEVKTGCSNSNLNEEKLIHSAPVSTRSASLREAARAARLQARRRRVARGERSKRRLEVGDGASQSLREAHAGLPSELLECQLDRRLASYRVILGQFLEHRVC